MNLSLLLNKMKKFSKAVPLKELIKLELEKEGERKLLYITSGTELIDLATGGFRYGEVVLIAGRPAMGVTMHLIKSVLRISKSVPVLYCSLYLHYRGIVNQFFSIEIDGGKSFFNDNIKKSAVNTKSFDESILVSEPVFNSIEEYILLISHHVREDHVKVVVF